MFLKVTMMGWEWMAKLPDFEALAIFAKVVELRSFAAAAAELALSKATVSKAVSRLEERLGASLFNRTSRRLALTDAGKNLSERAARLLADGEAAENEALAQSAVPRGLVRLAVPMSFGVKVIAPLLPGFLAMYPEVSVDLHFSDAMVDLIGEGFDAGLRIASLPNSSLLARRLCARCRATPLRRRLILRSMVRRRIRCISPSIAASVMPICRRPASGATPMRAANRQPCGRPANCASTTARRCCPQCIAGLGIADLPEFIVGDAIAAKKVEVILKDWKQVEGAVHLVMPPGGPRPARVEALIDYLADQLARPKRRKGSASRRAT